MSITVSGVKWTETVEVTRTGSGVILQVQTKAGRFFRSTSFLLSKKEAKQLAADLEKHSSDRRLKVNIKRGKK